MSIAARLPALSGPALKTLVGRNPCPVATYRTIVVETAGVDLRSEKADTARRRFNAYYGVRRNAVWRERFYARFEDAKVSTLSASALFEDVVTGLAEDTGRVEASFGSKLVATLRPDSPIIDSVVRAWLAGSASSPPFKGGARATVSYYHWLEQVMSELSQSPEALAWSNTFESAFPTRAGDAPISRMKRLDFLIWGGAER
jgi:hypothetical protein